jgi:pilus assembly protein Flp/PilA
MNIVKRFITEDSGSNALEYGLIVALVSLAVVGGAQTAGTALGGMFTALGTRLDTLAGDINP